MIYVLSAGRVVGIVFLVIAIIVAAILFFPLTYKMDVDLDQMRMSFKIHWLFRLVRFRFRFEDEMELAVAVLFFTIDFLDEERNARRRERRKNRDRKNNRERVEKSRSERIFGFIRNSGHAISLIREYEILYDVLPLINVFMFRIRPRDIHGHVEFGLKDPSRTGEIVGAVAAIPFIYQTDLTIDPDFDTEVSYVNGDVHANGHILVLHALMLIVGLIRRESVRAFFGEFRRRRNN